MAEYTDKETGNRVGVIFVGDYEDEEVFVVRLIAEQTGQQYVFIMPQEENTERAKQVKQNIANVLYEWAFGSEIIRMGDVMMLYGEIQWAYGYVRGQQDMLESDGEWWKHH